MSDDNVISFEQWKEKFHPQITEMDKDAQSALVDQFNTLIDAVRRSQRAKSRNFIREHRQARGWTQDQLARRIGVTKMYVSGIERGDRAVSVERSMDMAKAFGVSVEDLWHEPKNNSPQV